MRALFDRHAGLLDTLCCGVFMVASLVWWLWFYWDMTHLSQLV